VTRLATSNPVRNRTAFGYVPSSYVLITVIGTRSTDNNNVHSRGSSVLLVVVVPIVDELRYLAREDAKGISSIQVALRTPT